MLKIGRRASCTISLVLSVVTLAAVVVAAFFMPRIAEVYCRAHVTPADAPFYLRYTFILVVSYLILAVPLMIMIIKEIGFKLVLPDFKNLIDEVLYYTRGFDTILESSILMMVLNMVQMEISQLPSLLLKDIQM